MSGSSRPPIPRDHLDVPSSAQTGFRYLRGLPWPYAPPLEWEDQHTRAEEQGPHAPELILARIEGAEATQNRVEAIRLLHLLAEVVEEQADTLEQQEGRDA